MTKAVLEAGSELEAMQTAAAVPSPALAVPASLHASLMARLDRLGPAKELAEIGAAIGREFSHALSAAVVRQPEPELVSSLDRLIRAGLLFRKGVPPHATYLFKHALVQDAAYGTLLRQPRRALHARIADTIESQFADIAESHPNPPPRHCTEAGLIDKAASLWGKAGLRSLEALGIGRGGRAITRALGQIATLPSTPVLRREKIKLQVALIYPLQHVKGLAAPETRGGRRAGTSADRTGGSTWRASRGSAAVVFGSRLFLANIVAFNGDVVRERAAQILAFAEKQGGTVPLMEGHRAMSAALVSDGKLRGNRPSTRRSGTCALRSGRTSAPGDAVCPRSPRGSVIVAVAGTVGAWLS